MPGVVEKFFCRTARGEEERGKSGWRSGLNFTSDAERELSQLAARGKAGIALDDFDAVRFGAAAADWDNPRSVKNKKGAPYGAPFVFAD
jgi:hypothetical protein